MARARLNRPSRRGISHFNPLRKPEIDFEIFVLPLGRADRAVGIIDGRGDTIGGLTLVSAGPSTFIVQGAAAVRGFGPLLYDAAATALRARIFPSQSLSAEARTFWARQGGKVGPLSPQAWAAKYGIAFDTLLVDPRDVDAYRRDHVYMRAVEEAADVAQTAEDIGLGYVADQTPMLPREKRERVARAGVKRSAPHLASVQELVVARGPQRAKANVSKWLAEYETRGGTVRPEVLWRRTDPKFPVPLWDLAQETFTPGRVWQWGDRLRVQRGTVEKVIAYTHSDGLGPRMGVWMEEGFLVQLWPGSAKNLQPNEQMFGEGYDWRKRLARTNRRVIRARRNPTSSALPSFRTVLAHLRALQWFYWTTHWTTSGQSFYGNHLLLQRLYEGKGGPDINEEIDQLGERMVAYFGPSAVDPVQVQQESTRLLATAAHGNPIASLLALEESLQQAIRHAWDLEQQAGDKRSLGIDDYLMGLANERDTARYLLRRVLA